MRAANASRARVRYRHPRRQPGLEDRLRPAFDAPRASFGDIFVTYMIWRREAETRLELVAGDPWHKLNDITRALVVRHLWRALEAIAKGSVVVVDSPAQQWSREIDDAFDDRGAEDPFAAPKPRGGDAAGPQFVNDR